MKLGGGKNHLSYSYIILIQELFVNTDIEFRRLFVELANMKWDSIMRFLFHYFFSGGGGTGL